jgi:hypothetical protein
VRCLIGCPEVAPVAAANHAAIEKSRLALRCLSAPYLWANSSKASTPTIFFSKKRLHQSMNYGKLRPPSDFTNWMTVFRTGAIPRNGHEIAPIKVA